MASNPYVNRVEYAGSTLIDLTGDTVTPETLAKGVTAHDASGAPITGTMEAGVYEQVTFIPNSGATTQTLGTSAAVVNNISSRAAGYTSDVSHPTGGQYMINTAGTYRITLQLGIYPNSTAATRLCAGIYSGANSVSGTRLALGVQAVTNLAANTPSKVVTVFCEYVGAFDAGDSVTIGAFADVTNARVSKGNSTTPDITFVRFERVA
jgi:hypothetical protein